MSFTEEKEGRRRRKSDPDSNDSDASAPPRRKRPPAGEVGNALRSAYERVVDEDIPPEMLDLLGKLG